MEKMGGGGHLTMAGAQTAMSLEDTLSEIEKSVSETAEKRSNTENSDKKVQKNGG
jgi:c-di-AMP phosphodiesterase-like protein